MNDPTTRWWWLRHAPVPDPESRITGRLDPPCDTSDEAWFAALANRLPQQPVLIESGLLRCTQTIGALEVAGLPLSPATIEPDFVEQDFGRWQGRSWAEIAAAGDPALEPFRVAPAGAVPPGGESFVTLVGRVSVAIRRLTSAHGGRDILAVAHAGTIRAALTLALGVEPATALSFVIEPLSLTRIDAIGSGWRVAGVNWLPH